MRTITVLLLSTLSLQISAQQIPNSSFDSVYFGGIDRVFNWITSDGMMMGAGTFTDTVLPLQPNTTYPAVGFQYHELLWMGQRIDTSPFSNIAIQLWSHPEKVKPNGAHYESMIVNGEQFRTDSTGFIDLSRCGIPFTDRPEVLYGLYRFVDSTLIGLNSGRCVILLKKWNAALGYSDTIGFVDNKASLAPQATWSPFQVPITYLSNDTPDSLVVAFYANSSPDQQSVLWLDELMLGPAVGISENTLPPPLLYPNPTAGLIEVRNFKAYNTYTLFDSSGQSVYSGAVESSLNLHPLATGVYFITFNGNGFTSQTIRIVKTD